ncbi:MAG: preprotein translocase subunit SecG [Planctomycetota bacterium]
MLILKALLWVVFFLSAVIMIVVILLQEPKGGGLAEAFGGMGAETFGVKAGGINRFTFSVFSVFLCAAILLHVLRHSGTAIGPTPNQGTKIGQPGTPGVPPGGNNPGGGNTGGNPPGKGK